MLASARITPESKRTARFIDTLTRRNVTLDEYEADPTAFWHPSRGKEERRGGHREHRGAPRR